MNWVGLKSILNNVNLRACDLLLYIDDEFVSCIAKATFHNFKML